MKHCRLLAFTALLPLLQAHAQDVKNEVETSIAREAMPEKSLKLLEPVLAEARKVRFYRETDGEQVTYESKVKWKGHQYSIEFEQDGSLLNAEKLVRYGSLPGEVREAVNGRLKKEFGKYKVRRTQVQYSAGESGLSDAEVIGRLGRPKPEDVTVRYELEVDAVIPPNLGAYELLFDAEGNVLERRKITRRPLDNILY
ncbi:MAG: hypothetical protein ICV83_24615 [Cytophagales bacterium]|nr:hypothetical protein [Cytophagales bacterium]